MDKTENPFLVTLRLPVKNSPVLLIFVLTVHFICLFLPWATNISLYIKNILSGFVLISLFYYLYKYNFSNAKKRVAELILASDDSWQVKMNDGAVNKAKLHHSIFVHPWLSIISLTFGNSREYFIFTPETLNADQFRRLRVRLRFQVGE
jgi:hypothetical protein